MPCRSPLLGYRKPDGSVGFSRNDTSGRFAHLTLSCGVCIDCRIRKARDWAIRCAHEAQTQTRSSFLTLTYASDPGSISKRDLQLFFKQLRNQGSRFTYFACGEYGEQFARPHYHVCMFGEDFPDKYAWNRAKGGVLYRSDKLEKAWPHGHAKIGSLTDKSAGYTARYNLKKITGDKSIDHYMREFNGFNINIQPEFQLQSTRPAIGLVWIRRYWKDVFPRDEVVFNGKTYQPPDYYMRWLKHNQPEMHTEVLERRIEAQRDAPFESGERQYFAAKARDGKYKSLKRDYENTN